LSVFLDNALLISDYDGCEHAICTAFEQIEKRPHSIIYTKYICSEIVIKILAKAGGSSLKVFGPALERTFGAGTLEELRSFMLSALDELKSADSLRKEKNRGDKRIDEIFSYIDANYMNDIGLESTAKNVYLSPGYLSAFFKNATGQSIIKYITEYRLRKAKELLRTHKNMRYLI